MAPYVADGLGRKWGIIIGSFIVLIGAILQTATQNLGMFIGSRFCVGFGTTFAQMASPLLISEIAYPTHRGPLTSLFNTLWFSGSIVAAWSTFGTFRINSDWSWRIPSALQGLSSVIQLLFIVSNFPEISALDPNLTIFLYSGSSPSPLAGSSTVDVMKRPRRSSPGTTPAVTLTTLSFLSSTTKSRRLLPSRLRLPVLAGSTCSALLVTAAA
jgi:MFS family permease